MSTSNKHLMLHAREVLRGNWWMAAVAVGLYWGVQSLLDIIPVIGWIGALVASGPLTVGLSAFCLSLSRAREPRVGLIFERFTNFFDSMVAFLLCLVYTMLWALLLIVPGIVAALSYSMTFFILADNPGMDGAAAVRKSVALMKGKRRKLFLLGCRFIGWFLLGIVTMGIGFIWILPYFHVAMTLFYEDAIKDVGLSAPPAVPKA
jgi:uncharacterized membrane protein